MKLIEVHYVISYAINFTITYTLLSNTMDMTKVPCILISVALMLMMMTHTE